MNHQSMSVDCDEVIELVIVLVSLLMFNVPKKHRAQRTLCVRFGCGILMPQNFKRLIKPIGSCTLSKRMGFREALLCTRSNFDLNFIYINRIDGIKLQKQSDENIASYVSKSTIIRIKWIKNMCSSDASLKLLCNYFSYH